MEDLTPHLFDSSDHWKTQVNKAKIIMELHELQAKHSSVTGNLTMDVRPTRGIFSKCSYPKNKLFLVPLTDKIAEKQPNAGMWVEIGNDKHKTVFSRPTTLSRLRVMVWDWILKLSFIPFGR